MWKIIVFCVFVCLCFETLRASIVCHDDPTYQPYPGMIREVQYTWLGALQYIHIKNGTPFYFRVPRVILISRKFVLSTARDASHVPDEYALGNVVFSDYEKDEQECGVNRTQVEVGIVCEPAILIMPIADVLVHPEYVNFHWKTSLAVLKLILPIKSDFVVPICLPFLDYANMDDKHKLKPEMFYHVDFTNDVPRDFMDEQKEVTNLLILNKNQCTLLDERSNLTTSEREACTTGCNLRSGAPTIVHEHTGHWTLVALAQGGPECRDPFLERSSPVPSKHILVYPYVNWITRAITGQPALDLAKSDPFGYVAPRSFPEPPDPTAKGWVGKWWMGGKRCYDRGMVTLNYFRFYHEMFFVLISPSTPTLQLKQASSYTYYIQIDAPSNVRIICVKVGAGYHLATPELWGLEESSVKLRIVLWPFVKKYQLEVEAYGTQFSDDVWPESDENNTASE